MFCVALVFTLLKIFLFPFACIVFNLALCSKLIKQNWISNLSLFLLQALKAMYFFVCFTFFFFKILWTYLKAKLSRGAGGWEKGERGERERRDWILSVLWLASQMTAPARALSSGNQEPSLRLSLPHGQDPQHPRALESHVRSWVAKTQTGTHMGYWHHRQWLNVLFHMLLKSYVSSYALV